VTLSYADAVNWYYSFARFDRRPARNDTGKLDRMRALLQALGDPQTQYPMIHIAGTKGKGSTAAIIESMFRAGGYRTGLFTSPHLHSFRERVRLNFHAISEDALIALTMRLQALAPAFPKTTFFEWVTALALLYFAEQRVEMAIIETGLGGRLDCTNVVTPRLSVITPISLDHTEILGKNILKIAREKAGIIKPGVPVVIAPQELRVLGEVLRKAHKEQARVINVEKNWRWELVKTTPEAQFVRVRFIKNARWQTFILPLLGPHQRVNLVTALATLDVLHGRNWRISLGSLQHGAANVEWAARFEILAYLDPPERDPAPKEADPQSVNKKLRASDSPVELDRADKPPAQNADDETRPAPRGYVVADGAHNAASAHELVRTLDEVFPNVPVHFIFAASADKDIAGMLSELAPRAASFTLTQAQTPRAAALETLVALLTPYNIAYDTAPDIAQALEQMYARIEPGEILCVTGSLFIAAEARAQFFEIIHDSI
jgi:dihydrofolate synthase/folylpolyglutamate synthase